jgi:hypothetical protein
LIILLLRFGRIERSTKNENSTVYFTGLFSGDSSPGKYNSKIC